MTILRGQQRPFDRRYRTHYCHRCESDTQQVWLYSSNGSTPEVEHWSCAKCGAQFYAMGDARRGGVGDGDGLCKFVVNELVRTRRRRGDQRDSDPKLKLDQTRERGLDYDDLLGWLRECLLKAWCEFNPTLAPSFTAYATTILRNRRTDWLRKQLGRDEPCACKGRDDGCETCGGSGRHVPVPNALAAAVSIDAHERRDTLDLDIPGAEHDPLRGSVGETVRQLAEDGRDDSLAALEWALVQRHSQ